MIYLSDPVPYGDTILCPLVPLFQAGWPCLYLSF